MRLLLSFVLTFCFVHAKHEMYDGHSLFKIKIQDEKQMKYLYSLAEVLDLDVWVLPFPGNDAAVLVSKESNEPFRSELSEYGFEFQIETDNIKRALDLEDTLNEKALRKNHFKSGYRGKIGFDRIYKLSEVDSYLETLAESYPNTVTLVNAGKSFEGRDIKYLKISSTNFQDVRKPIVFVESLLHAREWVTLPPTLWAIEKLVVNVTESDLIDTIDWIILPVANPDGYELTHNEDRFWRKNRATGFVPGDFCVGVDLNRNFDIKWGSGSSSSVCSEIFHGSRPSSEPETVIISRIMEEYRNRIDLFIDLHSYGSMILYGWGSGDLLPNAFSLQQIGLNMAKAIDDMKLIFNENYTVGNAGLVLYPASGTAMDYANRFNIPFSYVYELPGSIFGTGLSGFLIEPELVEHYAKETWEGIKTGARNVRDLLGR
ncbi:carboxypeptidase B-like [Danaus plexippus]|uniref:carboxypeptidase B-like n=1 Tax=Danaus plexippus TaxID=13037 RepID=UPI002AB1D782|nr:carboxypeptidase B-like [Danaus plexippus]